MNVVEEKIDALNAVLRVTIQPEDYREKVEKTLNDYRKNANIPGFRPGKVPTSLIKKKYGKAILAEELNKAVQHSLSDFIRTNNLNILGQPLPKEDEEVKGDFDQPDTFEFAYEVGVSPEFVVNLSKKNKFDYLKVKITDKMLDEEIENLCRRYGKLVSADEVGEKDMIVGTFAELDGKELKEGGIHNSSTISMEFIEDEKTKKSLLGKKAGDEVVLDPRKVSKGDSDMAAMLAIDKEVATELKSDFRFTITEIRKMIPAELNQELFDKLFGEGVVTSVDELKNKMREDMSNMYSSDADRHFSRQVTDELMEKTKIDLPEDFLKRWIVLSSNNEVSKEQVENEFDNYRNSLKWQLIQNKLIQENNIKVEPQEAIDYTKGLLARQFAQYGMPPPEDSDLEAQARSVLSNQEEANRIYDNIYGVKLMNFFKDVVKVNEKEVSYDKFIEEAFGQK